MGNEWKEKPNECHEIPISGGKLKGRGTLLDRQKMKWVISGLNISKGWYLAWKLSPHHHSSHNLLASAL